MPMAVQGPPESLEVSSRRKYNISLSKKLSWLLRHHLELVFEHFSSENVEEEVKEAKETGFVDIEAVLKVHVFRTYSLDDIRTAVSLNDKNRFCIRRRAGRPGTLQIRANQGHTIRTVNPDLKLVTDVSTPVIHGTYLKCWTEIEKSGGLSRMARNHIHFSKGLPGDDQVISGMRRDCSLLIYVDFKKAVNDGFEFYESINGVLLCAGDANGFLPSSYFEKVVDRRTNKLVQYNYIFTARKVAIFPRVGDRQHEGNKAT